MKKNRTHGKKRPAKPVAQPVANQSLRDQMLARKGNIKRGQVDIEGIGTVHYRQLMADEYMLVTSKSIDVDTLKMDPAKIFNSMLYAAALGAEMGADDEIIASLKMEPTFVSEVGSRVMIMSGLLPDPGEMKAQRLASTNGGATPITPAYEKKD